MMSKALSSAALFVAAAVLPLTQATAGTLTVLTSFNGAAGEDPRGSLIFDSAGNLYGTTETGGVSKGADGTVFKLAPPAAGQTAWTETVLTTFKRTNGRQPLGSLIFDSAGNLYGTTEYGGTSNDGTVFELMPPPAGRTAWSESLLTSFNGTNGKDPRSAGLIADSAGNLYGTTAGLASNGGTVFKLAPPAAGQTAWTVTVLLSFKGKHGGHPVAGLIADSAGNLYGTTVGTAFKLAPPAAGQTAWTATVLINFNGTIGGVPSGYAPEGSLIFDSAGNLYGTTNAGGAFGEGTVFELSPPAAGQTAWTQTILTSFDGTNGEFPSASLIFDGSGNLYGTTYQGGDTDSCYGGCGTVFELAPPAAGQTAWTETVVVSFNGANGAFPTCSLIADSAGNLYGTTSGGGPAYQKGGSSGYGTVFELTP